MRRYTKPTLRRGGRRRPAPALPEGLTLPVPDLRLPAGTQVGRILIEAYGQIHEAKLLQPGDKRGRRARSDHVAIEIDGQWIAATLADAAKAVAKRVPRRLTLEELREIDSMS